MISTLFCTQMFHLLFDSLIHHTAIWLSVQQNTYLTCTSNLTELTTETTSFDKKTQVKFSKRGILRSFIGATLHFPAHKFTLTPWLQTTLNNRAVCLSRTISKSMNFYHPVPTVTQNMTLNDDAF